jgi:hypothetical protein
MSIRKKNNVIPVKYEIKIQKKEIKSFLNIEKNKSLEKIEVKVKLNESVNKVEINKKKDKDNALADKVLNDTVKEVQNVKQEPIKIYKIGCGQFYTSTSTN